LSVLLSGRNLHSGRFLVHFSYRLNQPQDHIRLEGLSQLENASGIEPATFLLAAYSLNLVTYSETLQTIVSADVSNLGPPPNERPLSSHFDSDPPDGISSDSAIGAI
jgi:hypothetical protein